MREPNALEESLLVAIVERFRLDGKVAIVTGASSGLGVAFAEGLAEAGADVVLAARRAQRLESTAGLVTKHRRQCLSVQADVSRPEDCSELVRRSVEAFGTVDVLVNNAGIGTVHPATRETPEQFREVIEVNLNGCYWMAQECGRVMRPGSSIINIGSILGLTSGRLPQAAYSSSKAALIGLTRDLAAQWSGRKGIRINCLASGWFTSEMTAHLETAYLDSQIARTIVGRLGNPDELAAAVIFLASEASSYITGITLPVDGGLLAN